MSIDFITEQPTLPKIDKDARRPEEIVEYLTRLVGILQENLLRTVVQMMNLQLSMVNVGVFYFSLPDINGAYADNSWRLIKSGDGIEIQKKLSGTWTKVSRWEY